jgi:hypothetical protein
VPHRAELGLAFDRPTELIGHVKLRLFVSTEGGDDMDLFVAIQKLDAAGVPFAFYAHFENGSVALGWLSNRELPPQANIGWAAGREVETANWGSHATARDAAAPVPSSPGRELIQVP